MNSVDQVWANIQTYLLFKLAVLYSIVIVTLENAFS